MTWPAYMAGVATPFLLQLLLAVIRLWRHRRALPEPTPFSSLAEDTLEESNRSRSTRSLTREDSSSVAPSPRRLEQPQQQPQQQDNVRLPLVPSPRGSEDSSNAVPSHRRQQDSRSKGTRMPSHAKNNTRSPSPPTGTTLPHPSMGTWLCRLCDRTMVERRDRRGGTFLGCPNFPTCRGSRSIANPLRASLVAEIRRRWAAQGRSDAGTA